MKKRIFVITSLCMAVGVATIIPAQSVYAEMVQRDDAIAATAYVEALSSFLEKNNIPAYIMDEAQAEEYDLYTRHITVMSEYGEEYLDDEYIGVLLPDEQETFYWVYGALRSFQQQYEYKTAKEIPCFTYTFRYEYEIANDSENVGEKLTDLETIYSLMTQMLEENALLGEVCIDTESQIVSVYYEWRNWMVGRAFQATVATYNIDRTKVTNVVAEGGSESYGNYVAGDVNEDGSLNISDAILLSRFTAEDTTAAITQQGIWNADFNADTFSDIDDITAMLRNMAGL